MRYFGGNLGCCLQDIKAVFVLVASFGTAICMVGKQERRVLALLITGLFLLSPLMQSLTRTVARCAAVLLCCSSRSGLATCSAWQPGCKTCDVIRQSLSLTQPVPAVILSSHPSLGCWPCT